MKPYIHLATVIVALTTLVSNTVAQPSVYTPKSPVELMVAIAKQGRPTLEINSKPTNAFKQLENNKFNSWQISPRVDVPLGYKEKLDPKAPSISIVRANPNPKQPVDSKPTTSAVTQPVANPDGKYNTESSRMFATKVQPILNNMCATCHTKAESAGGFVLKRMDENFANPEAVEHNLRATVRFLNPESPGISTFLMNAVTAHGTTKEPPIRMRTIPAFRTLELWAHWATSAEGMPMPNYIPIAAATTTKSTVVINPNGPSGFAAGEIQQVGAKEPAPKPGNVPHLTIGTTEPGKLPPLTPSSSPPTAVPSTPMPQSNDPYDPNAFNRYAFPTRK